MMKHIGMNFIHGVSPSPQVEQKMRSKIDDPRSVNDLVHIVIRLNRIRRLPQF